MAFKIKRTRYERKVVCYWCHKKGHLKRDFEDQKRYEEEKKTWDGVNVSEHATWHGNDEVLVTAINLHQKINQRNVQCRYCKKYSHMKRKCRKLRRKNMNTLGSPNDDGWVLDSGSSVHVCFKKEIFHYFKEFRSTVSLGDGSSYDVRGIGSMKLKTPVGVIRILDDVNFIPKMQRNLISLSWLDFKGCQISVTDEAMEVT
ncbi:uncharacterized protein LOC131148110 [Malania oleifera]|uniref:uncharacterized protein LOC131148110 n=1 Tax=Malania oleifera TaxID=397392 RepID=UPI0025AE5493|nr:uncharacterized protein LOC131148110 [Malania oleifera]